MNRGEVWWYEDETAARRPHLILSRSAAIPVVNQVIAVPATTVVRGVPTEVPLGRDDGMPQECVLSLDNVRVVRKSLCVKKITALSAEKMAQVCSALKIAVDC